MYLGIKSTGCHICNLVGSIRYQHLWCDVQCVIFVWGPYVIIITDVSTLQVWVCTFSQLHIMSMLQFRSVISILGLMVASGVCALHIPSVMNMCSQCVSPAICNLHSACPFGNHHTGCHGCQWACFCTRCNECTQCNVIHGYVFVVVSALPYLQCAVKLHCMNWQHWDGWGGYLLLMTDPLCGCHIDVL
jgi:hypothetical protein